MVITLPPGGVVVIVVAEVGAVSWCSDSNSRSYNIGGDTSVTFHGVAMMTGGAERVSFMFSRRCDGRSE